MKCCLVILCLVSLVFGCMGQQAGEKLSRRDTIDLHKKEEGVFFTPIHPQAKALLTEDFYWSLTDPTAPFGNEEGKMALYSFREWRKTHTSDSPGLFLTQLIARLDYPGFDLKMMQLDKISAYISAVPEGAALLTGTDNAVIAVGFAQFIWEGRIEEELKRLMVVALQRESLPVLIDHFPPRYQPERRELLSKMLSLLQ